MPPVSSDHVVRQGQQEAFSTKSAEDESNDTRFPSRSRKLVCTMARCIDTARTINILPIRKTSVTVLLPRSCAIPFNAN